MRHDLSGNFLTIEIHLKQLICRLVEILRGDSYNDDLKSAIVKNEIQKSLSEENRIRVLKSEDTKNKELLKCLKHLNDVVESKYSV